MIIAHYKRTDIAYAPEELSDCINKYTKHKSYINQKINESDILVYHNKYIKYMDLYKLKINSRKLLHKKSFMLYHSFPEITDNYNNVILMNSPFLFSIKKIINNRSSSSVYLEKDQAQFLQHILPHRKSPIHQMVMSQYQATLTEYNTYKRVRNIIDFNKKSYHIKSIKRKNIRIGYSPSITIPSNRSIWETKGYRRTVDILNKISKIDGVECDIITDVSLDECLKRKSNCDIIIDECVTSSYHRSGLEGLALGKLTICSLDEKVMQIIKEETGSNEVPFDNVWINDLEKYLKELIHKGKNYIYSKGKNNRLWMEKYWNPKDIVQDYIKYFKSQINNKSAISRLDSRFISRSYDYLYPKQKFTHIGVHSLGNAGDNVLFHDTRNIFDLFLGKSQWVKKKVRRFFSEKDIENINYNTDGIILGGGGLLLKDTATNNNSGWQWNCPVSLINKIKVPLVIFAIGYNRFYNQEDFDNIFHEHINQTVSKASFFGLRNFGSIESLKEYLPKELHHKLIMQPCPTTLLSYLHPYLKKNNNKEKHLSLNLAFDRLEKRFGQNLDKLLNNIINAIYKLQKDDWSIDYVKHSVNDELAIPFLKKKGINFNYINLDKRPQKEVIEYYNNIKLAVGMRGHSQMIPFGLQNNIVSIISHPKLLYFLKDINQETWGVDINSNSFENELIEKIKDIGHDNWDMHNKILIREQKNIYDRTTKNFDLIKDILG